MSIPESRLLPEALPVSEVLDDPEFTDVTTDGEVYTRYRVVRLTHEFTAHPEGWTHLANVVRMREPAIGVALLQVKARSIEESRVTLSPIND